MNKEQVITIQGKESEWYKQAVFVMKEGVVSRPIHQDLTQEAEWIISKHLKKNGFACSKLDKILNLVLWGSVCVLMICLSFL